jgi:hypothetical protein
MNICARMMQFMLLLNRYAPIMLGLPPSCMVVKIRATLPALINTCVIWLSSPVLFAAKLAAICGARPYMSMSVVALYPSSRYCSG